MKKNLLNLTVLNTRPSNSNYVLSKQINSLGGNAIELPLINIKPTKNWQNDLPNLNEIKIIIFFSANAVEYFFTSLANEITFPKNLKVIAIGKATADTLLQYKIKEVKIPKYATSESLITLPSLKTIKGQKILLVKGQGGRTVVEKELFRRGGNIFVVKVYKRIQPVYTREYINTIQKNKIDIILFTSVEAIHNLFSILEENKSSWLSKPCIVISERIAEVSKSLGMQTIVASYDNLIAELLKFNEGLNSGKQY